MGEQQWKSQYWGTAQKQQKRALWCWRNDREPPRSPKRRLSLWVLEVTYDEEKGDTELWGVNSQYFFQMLGKAKEPCPWAPGQTEFSPGALRVCPSVHLTVKSQQAPGTATPWWVEQHLQPHLEQFLKQKVIKYPKSTPQQSQVESSTLTRW